MVYKIFTPKFLRKLTTDRKCTPEQYYVCQWQKEQEVQFWYVLYRLTMAVITFCIAILSVLYQYEEDPESSLWKWLIFMTHWGYMVIILQFFLGAIIAAHRYTIIYLKDQVTEPSIKYIHKAYGVFHTMAAVLAFGITGLYWILIYDPSKHQLDFMNFAMHAFNSVIMLVDLFLVAHPLQIRHVVYPFLFAIVYSLFTYIYFLLGGTGKKGNAEIYPIINWNKPVQTLLIITMAIFLVFVLYTVTFFVVILRERVAQKIYTKKYETNSGGAATGGDNVTKNINNNTNTTEQQNYVPPSTVEDVV